MNLQRYPVIEHRPLTPVRAKLFSVARRDPAELPTPQSGTVWVFEIDGRCEQTHPRHFRGNEEIVRYAVGVSVVDVTRDRLIAVDVDIPSKSATEDFHLSVTFGCTVTDPRVVVRDNVTDLTEILAAHVQAAPQLHEIGASFDVEKEEDVTEVRKRARALVRARYAVRPPVVAGITVTLSKIDIRTPAELRSHRSAMVAEERRQEFTRSRTDFDYEEAERFAGLTAPEQKEAVAVTRGETSAAEAANRAFEARDRQNALMAQLVRLLADNGQLDRVPVDGRRFVESLGDRLLGPAPAADIGVPPALEDSGRRPLQPGSAGDDEESPSRPAADDDHDYDD